MTATRPDAETAPPDLWDPIVRITHWGIAVVVLGNALVTEDGSTAHVTLGWIGMSFLLLRLVWGVVGPAEARFSAFPPRPRAALSHVAELVSGRPRQYASHNPAGAMMVYALWLTLAVVIGSGLAMTQGATPWTIAEQRAAVAAGDWSVLVPEGDGAGGDGETADGDERDGGWVKEMHEVAANLLLVFAVLHVAGVAVESLAMRRNLVRPMIVRAGSATPRK